MPNWASSARLHVLFTGPYPVHYFFIPGTLADDGDPLDVLALVEETKFLRLRDRGPADRDFEHDHRKKRDQKSSRLPTATRFTARFKISTRSSRTSAHEIEHFFTIYQELEGARDRHTRMGAPEYPQNSSHCAPSSPTTSLAFGWVDKSQKLALAIAVKRDWSWLYSIAMMLYLLICRGPNPPWPEVILEVNHPEPSACNTSLTAIG